MTGLMLSDVGIALEDLLADQLAAVTAREGPLLVLGAAGTGKTRVLLERFHWLVEQGTRTEAIAVLAPSSGRADAIRAALESGVRGSYEELFVCTPVELAAVLLNDATPGADVLDSVVDAGERFAMLLERFDELSIRSHDFGGSATALLAGFVRKIDRLKSHLIGAEDYASWAERLEQAGAEARGGAARSSSSPRSTARTSGCSPRQGWPTRATCSTRRCERSASGPS